MGKERWSRGTDPSFRLLLAAAVFFLFSLGVLTALAAIGLFH